jgi:hypothetical protein
VTLGDGIFRKSLMKMTYRKFPKTASLPVTRHPQPLPFVCDNTKALSERFTETNSKVIAEWGNCGVWTPRLVAKFFRSRSRLE